MKSFDKGFLFDGKSTYTLRTEGFVFDAKLTFECGQCFRFDDLGDGSFGGVFSGRHIVVRGGAGNVSVKVLSGEKTYDFCRDLDRFFDVSENYAALTEALSEKDDVMKKASACAFGIRLLRQDFFETVVSFIISANNNIPRIKKCIENICRIYGVDIGDGTYAFPSPCSLSKADPGDLCSLCRVGYRGPYIVKTAQLFESGAISFDDLCEKDPDKRNKILLDLPGVGPKVLNCILLFSGLDRSSFPVDVWVEKMMEELYGFRNASRKHLEDYGKEYFGENAGLAQQYLFYYIRQIHGK